MLCRLEGGAGLCRPRPLGPVCQFCSGLSPALSSFSGLGGFQLQVAEDKLPRLSRFSESSARSARSGWGPKTSSISRCKRMSRSFGELILAADWSSKSIAPSTSAPFTAKILSPGLMSREARRSLLPGKQIRHIKQRLQANTPLSPQCYEEPQKDGGKAFSLHQVMTEYLTLVIGFLSNRLFAAVLDVFATFEFVLPG